LLERKSELDVLGAALDDVVEAAECDPAVGQWSGPCSRAGGTVHAVSATGWRVATANRSLR